jgi:hypothetical protein
LVEEHSGTDPTGRGHEMFVASNPPAVHGIGVVENSLARDAHRQRAGLAEFDGRFVVDGFLLARADVGPLGVRFHFGFIGLLLETGLDFAMGRPT